MRPVPFAAVLIAAAWLAAQALASPGLGAATVVAGIGGCCLLGARRRRSRHLQLALAPVLLVLAAVLAVLVLHPEHPHGFVLQLVLLLLLAPAVPLIYAATVPRDPGER